jgi:ribosomal protein S18 acetylase RimI-like enzyme
MHWRDRVRDSDRQAVRQLVAATGFFNREEEEIAVELVDEALARGRASGYEFIFADAADGSGALLGYSCFGPIDGQPGAFDLYWIAVSPARQRHGLGRQLIDESERRIGAEGGTEVFIDTSGRGQYRPTRDFYERMGYRVHEVLPDYYAPGDDKVIYAKSLKAET